MDDLEFEKGVFIAFIILAYISLFFLYLTARAVLKSLRILRNNEFESQKNLSRARLNLLLIGVAVAIVAYLLSLFGEPSKGSSYVARLGMIAFGMATVGIASALFMKPAYPQQYDLLRPLKKIPVLRWVISRKYVLVPLIIFLPLVSLFAYAIIGQWIQKRDFEQARAAIDTIYISVVKEVGLPDDNERDSRCSRSREEFSSGSLGCYINTFFIYGVKDIEQSDQISKRVSSIIKSSQQTLVSIPSPRQSRPSITKAPGNTSITDYYKSAGGLSCQADYEFDTEYGSFLKLKNPNDKKLAINISCSGNAFFYDFPFLNHDLSI